VVTDTGELAEMLDTAHRAWPELDDRRQLLLRLAAVGHEAVSARLAEEDVHRRRARQRAALERAAERVDRDALLRDAAWQ
jgi:hypothetical protein